MSDEQEPPTLTVICPKCRTTYPVAVTMDYAGRIVDDPLDFADMWAHHWTHTHSRGRS